MDVLFCDICNESVPQPDLERGRAFLRKGRVVCARCDLAMGGAASRPEPPIDEPATGEREPAPAPAGSPAHAQAAAAAPAGAGLAIVLASLGIVLSASVAVLLFERLDQAGRRAEEGVRDLRAEVRGGMDGLRDEVVQGASARAEEGRRVEREIASLVAREDERVRAQAEALAGLEDELERLAGAVESRPDVGDEIVRVDRRVAELAGAIAELRADVGLIAERVLAIEERPAAAPPAAEAAEATPEAAWAARLADLQSPSSGARWSAVQDLGQTLDPAVAPHLLPMLADLDIFVRMAAARWLGELGAPIAIPALIDALEDAEASVREQAVVSLRRITGQNFKFDPTANEGERAKKVKAWRDWWKREGEAELGRP